ncbi:MAG: amidohydrolase [Promethearchaeota archaeon]|nr:MAG: amidohydrolase [Candidatus Lokiarchaeota archaeon]
MKMKVVLAALHATCILKQKNKYRFSEIFLSLLVSTWFMSQVFSADRIYSMDSPNEFYRAMIIENGKITRLLDMKTFEAEKTTYSNIIELEGFIFPGFIDSHIHAISYGRYMEYVDLRNVHSIKEMVEIIAEKVKTTSEGEWIYGIAWNQEKFSENRYPTKDDLDTIGSKNPIVLKRVCTHVLVVNSVILEQANITRDTPDPEGGIIDRDIAGYPTGILRENATDLIASIEPKPSRGDLIRWQKKSQKYLNAFGITSVHTLDEECYPAYRTIKDSLTLRVYFCPKHNKLDFLYNEEPNAKTGLGDDMLRLGRVKLFADGSLGAKTAAMRDPYETSEDKGVPIHTKEDLCNIIEAMNRKGWQLETHVIGDKGAEMVLDCYENIYKHDYRPILTHCQILAKDLVQRMAKSEVIASIQPFFIETDMDFVEKFIGVERMKYSYAWKTLLEYGIKCCGGSDAPVDIPNPFNGIYAAVTRKKLDGSPATGWLPEQKLTVWDALRLYTYGGAYAEYQEHQKGLLKPGYLADFIVLDKDPFDIPTHELKDIQVKNTFLGGKEVFSRIS